MDNFRPNTALPPEFLQALSGGMSPGQGSPASATPSIPAAAVPPAPTGMQGAPIHLGSSGPTGGGLPPEMMPSPDQFANGAQPDPLSMMGQVPSPVNSLPSAPTGFQAQLQGIANDPVLSAILSGQTPLVVQDFLPTNANRSLRKPSWSEIIDWKNYDKNYWKDRNKRIARDIRIFRQGEGGVPNLFDPEEDTQFISAAMSNVVNRMSNMMAGVAIKVDAPSWNDESDKKAQTIENFCYWDMDQTRRQYASSGGSSRQRDEFFYLFLHGILAARILTDVQDPKYPWNDDLLDPATCYPTYGNGKQGMTRMIRSYTSTASELLDTYGSINTGLQRILLKEIGNTQDGIGNYLNKEFEVVEYADRRWRGVCLADGTPILPLTEHGYGKVPYIYLTAIGEPKAMQDAEAGYAVADGPLGGMNIPAGKKVNVAEKGVSVIHYLIHTHRLREAVYTILYQQIEKSGAPPTMRYRAPQLMGKDSPVLDWKINGTNYAALNLEKVEALPTSPQPTDVSPTLSVLEQEQQQGTASASGAGFEPGGNASGYALDTLIAAAKELVLPYFLAYENYLMLKFELKLEQFRDVIGEFFTLSVPNRPSYGRPKTLTDLTVDAVNMVGCEVKVKVRDNSDAARAQRAQLALQLMSGGLVSQKRAMDLAGEDNPDEQYAEIMIDNAMQNPTVMQLYNIPAAFKARGADNMAQIWMEIVGKPIIQQMMMQQMMMGAPQQGAPGGGGGSPGGGNPAPPQTGGQSFGPTAAGSPGGPQPGHGRGESQG